MMKSISQNTKRILLVDDDPYILHALLRIFRKTDYQIKGIQSGEAACDLIEQWHPHLVILDVNMPGLDGYGVMEKIQNKIESKELHIVMLTGRASDNDMLKGYAKGADYYITKPFENKYVINIVNYLIGDVSEAEKRMLEIQL